MKLRKPPFPEALNTATYFYIHTCHRQTAIETAIAVIRKADEHERDALARDPVWQALTNGMGIWVIESLLQGAWMREYHEWEKATKVYFDGNHARNGSSAVNWKGKLSGVLRPSHVDRVRAQFALFNASIPVDALAAIDRSREQVNFSKHEAEHRVGEADYQAFIKAVLAFWEALTTQEEFTPPYKS